MISVPLYTTPKLQDAVVQEINSLLTSYVEYLYGIAHVSVDNNGDGFPTIHYNDGSKRSFMIFPDSRVKSFGFWEFSDASIENEDEGITYRLSFIFWGNLNRIDDTKNYDFTAEIQQNILRVLKDYGAYNISYSEEDVFYKYSKYVENEKQALMRPNTAFKISMDIHDFIC